MTKLNSEKQEFLKLMKELKRCIINEVQMHRTVAEKGLQTSDFKSSKFGLLILDCRLRLPEGAFLWDDPKKDH